MASLPPRSSVMVFPPKPAAAPNSSNSKAGASGAQPQSPAEQTMMPAPPPPPLAPPPPLNDLRYSVLFHHASMDDEEEDAELLWHPLFGEQLTDEEIEKAAKGFSEDTPKHKYCLATILIKAANRKMILQAVDMFQKLCTEGTQKSRPFHRDSMYYIAVGYYILGDLAETKMWVEKLLRVEPEHQQGIQLLEIVDQAIEQARKKRLEAQKKLASKRPKNLFASTAESNEDLSALQEPRKRGTEDLAKRMNILHTENYFSKFSPEEMEYLMKSFNNIDGLGARSFDKGQLTKAHGILGASNNEFVYNYLFSAFEVVKSRMANQNVNEKKSSTGLKVVEFEAYVVTYAILIKGTKREQLELAFDMLDSTKSGYITEQDIANQVEHIFQLLDDINLETVDSKAAAQYMFSLLDPEKKKQVPKEQFVNQAIKFNRPLSTMGLLHASTREAIPSLGRQKGIPAIGGSTTFQTTIDIMLGMRLSQDMCRFVTRKIKPEDFTAEIKFQIPRRKPKTKAAENDGDDGICTYTDFAPRVFQRLREIHGISESEYLASIGPEQLLGNMLLGNLTSLSEKPSEGKSGALFYYSADGKFIIKQIPSIEAHSFRKTLPEYYHYIIEHPNSLLCRYFGHFEIESSYFIVMKNVFTTLKPIHEIYDLKGSKIARSNPQGPIYKDNDLQQKINLGQKRNMLLNIVNDDIRFLHELKFTDYSLLLGIHFKNGYPGRQANLARLQQQKAKPSLPEKKPVISQPVLQSSTSISPQALINASLSGNLSSLQSSSNPASKSPQPAASKSFRETSMVGGLAGISVARNVNSHIHQQLQAEIQAQLGAIQQHQAGGQSNYSSPPPSKISPFAGRSPSTAGNEEVAFSVSPATPLSQSAPVKPSSPFELVEAGENSPAGDESIAEEEQQAYNIIQESIAEKPHMLLQQNEFMNNRKRSMTALQSREAKKKQSNIVLFDSLNGIESADQSQVYYLGIIDMLTVFDMKKLAELSLKSIKYPTRRNEISAQPPDEYAQRLKGFVSQIIE